MRITKLSKNIYRKAFFAIFFSLQIFNISIFATKKALPILDFWTKLALSDETLIKKTEKAQTTQLKIDRKLFFFDRTICKSLQAQERRGLFLSEKGRANLIIQIAEIKTWCSNSISELAALIKDLEPSIDETYNLLKEIEPLREKNDQQTHDGTKPTLDNKQTLKNLSVELSLLLDQKKNIDHHNQLNLQKTLIDAQILEEKKIITLLLRRKTINQNNSFIEEKIKKIRNKLKILETGNHLLISQIEAFNLPKNLTEEEIEEKKRLIHEKIEKIQKEESTNTTNLTQNEKSVVTGSLEDKKLKIIVKVSNSVESAKTTKTKSEETVGALNKTVENCEKIYKLINS